MTGRRFHWRLAALFCGSLALLVVFSESMAPDAREAAREQATARATPLILDIAESGPGELARGAAALGDTAPLRSPLLVALGAWAKLSFGRLGLLSQTTSARLPWLVVAALGPAAVGALGASLFGEPRGMLLGLALLLHPFWLLDAVRGCMAPASALLAVAATAACGPRSSRSTSSAVAALAVPVGMTVLPAVVWALPIAVGHRLWIDRRRRRAMPSAVSVPTWAVVAFAVSPAVVCALSPACWHGGVPGVARAWLESLGARGMFPPADRSDADYLTVALGVAATFALVVLALHGLRVVTGERRARDLSASALGLTGIVASAVAAASSDAAFGVGATGLLLGLPYLVLLAGFGLRALPRRCDECGQRAAATRDERA